MKVKLLINNKEQHDCNRAMLCGNDKHFNIVKGFQIQIGDANRTIKNENINYFTAQ